MRFLLVSVLTLLPTLIPAFGQTGLYSYDGGYFLRNGSHWEEYRPAERHEVWNEYEQVKTDGNFIYLKCKDNDFHIGIPTRNIFSSFLLMSYTNRQVSVLKA